MKNKVILQNKMLERVVKNTRGKDEKAKKIVQFFCEGFKKIEAKNDIVRIIIVSDEIYNIIKENMEGSKISGFNKIPINKLTKNDKEDNCKGTFLTANICVKKDIHWITLFGCNDADVDRDPMAPITVGEITQVMIKKTNEFKKRTREILEKELKLFSTSIYKVSDGFADQGRDIVDGFVDVLLKKTISDICDKIGYHISPGSNQLPIKCNGKWLDKNLETKEVRAAIKEIRKDCSPVCRTPEIDDNLFRLLERFARCKSINDEMVFLREDETIADEKEMSGFIENVLNERKKEVKKTSKKKIKKTIEMPRTDSWYKKEIVRNKDVNKKKIKKTSELDSVAVKIKKAKKKTNKKKNDKK